MIELKPNLVEAQRFLTLLDSDSEEFTFQIFAESDGSAVRPKILHGTLEQHADELIHANREGGGVFVAINETNLRGRKNTDIRRIRSVFIDADGVPLSEIVNVKAVPPPHILVESSPGRYHVYWLVKPMPLRSFKLAQQDLARLYNTDPSVHDLARVMRLPGFFHCKREPFQTRIGLAVDMVEEALRNYARGY